MKWTTTFICSLTIMVTGAIGGDTGSESRPVVQTDFHYIGIFRSYHKIDPQKDDQQLQALRDDLRRLADAIAALQRQPAPAPIVVPVPIPPNGVAPAPVNPFPPRVDIPPPGAPRIEIPAPGAPRIIIGAPSQPQIQIQQPGQPRIEIHAPDQPRIPIGLPPTPALPIPAPGDPAIPGVSQAPSGLQRYAVQKQTTWRPTRRD